MECTCKVAPMPDGMMYHAMSCPMRAVAGTRKMNKRGIKSVDTSCLVDAGFEYETNDCGVHAVASVTGVPYRDAHAWVARRMGRENGKGTPRWDVTFSSIATCRELVYGMRVFKYVAPHRVTYTRNVWGEVSTRNVYGTLAQFVRTHRTGRFLLTSNSHAFAVIDGVVYDNGAAGPTTRVISAYEFLESSKCEALGR